MKLNIIANPRDCREGYIHLPIVAVLPPEGFEFAQQRPINGTVEELLALDVLDFYPPEVHEGILTQWVDFLALHGRITVGCVDIHEVCAAVHNRVLHPDDAIKILHGQAQGKLYDPNKTGVRWSNSYLEKLAHELTSRGLKVSRRLHNKFMCIVTAEKV